MASSTDFIEQFVQQAGRLLNSSGVPQELESKLKVLAEGVFNRMDVVSRSEFDAQTAVLHRTREKLEKLEAEIKALQEKVDSME